MLYISDTQVLTVFIFTGEFIDYTVNMSRALSTFAAIENYMRSMQGCLVAR